MNPFQNLLQSPFKIFIICVFFSVLNLSLRETPLKLWNLKKEYKNALKKKIQVKKKLEQLKLKIKRASHLDFIEKEAKNRFDLAKKGELVFIFSSKKGQEKDEVKNSSQ